jgi:hypothetical protein
MAGEGRADIGVAVPLLVVRAVWVGQRGRHPDAGEELAEEDAVAGAAAAGPVRNGHDGGGMRVTRPPPLLAVCLLTAVGSPVPRLSSLMAPASP